MREMGYRHLNSMTGFGKSEIAIDGRKLRIEIKSVNHRFLDISIRQPRFMMCYEDMIRQFIKQHINRGRVDVFINYSSERADAKKVVTDMVLISAYVNAARDIAEKTGMQNDVCVSHLLKLPDAVTFEEDSSDEAAMQTLLLNNLGAAVSELQAARNKEGEQLKKDIVKRLGLTLQYAESIKSKGHTVVEEYRQKLNERLAELLDGAPVDAQRLAQEVALYADRCNITEELVRIKSHVKQFLTLADAQEVQGRNMDFIVQELNREFNTIGSKSQDTDILKAVIAGKGEIEKIREQIQNIE